MTIIKVKKATIATIILAIGVVSGISTCFATSSKPAKEQLRQIPNTDFSKEEYALLNKLRFNNYQNMTIDEFQQKIWKITDTKVYMELLERFMKDDTLNQLANQEETASFIFNILKPLTKEKWKVSDFGGTV